MYLTKVYRITPDLHHQGTATLFTVRKPSMIHVDLLIDLGGRPDQLPIYLHISMDQI